MSKAETAVRVLDAAIPLIRRFAVWIRRRRALKKAKAEGRVCKR